MNKVIFFLVVSTGVFAEPWGKDADICFSKRGPVITKKAHPVAEVLIGFHQKVVSPAQGPRSHYRPSSSQYTLEAMRCYGFFEGFLLGCDRLMRENDEAWIYKTVQVGKEDFMKLDPVR